MAGTKRKISNLLTARQLAEVIQVKPNTLLKWASQGEIPCVRLVGRCVRFDPLEVAEVIDQGRCPVVHQSRRHKILCDQKHQDQ